MRALCWNGVNDLRVETVADPVIVNPRDAILRGFPTFLYLPRGVWSAAPCARCT